jgi:hypothetical protein
MKKKGFKQYKNGSKGVNPGQAKKKKKKKRGSPGVICGGQSGTGTGFSPSSRFSPVNFIPLVFH